MHISQSDKDKIAAAVRAAETKTSGELVLVIAHAADDYLYIPLLWAALLALFVPAVMVLFGSYLEFALVYQTQILGFLFIAVLFRWPPLMLRLVPSSVKRKRAARLARSQFLAQNLHHTQGRTGILLFVSLAEHYVEIIADKGINDVVEVGAWEKVVAEFVQHIKSKKIVDGYLGAIASCGEILAQHFPGGVDNPDELPNHLIEI